MGLLALGFCSQVRSLSGDHCEDALMIVFTADLYALTGTFNSITEMLVWLKQFQTHNSMEFIIDNPTSTNRWS